MSEKSLMQQPYYFFIAAIVFLRQGKRKFFLGLVCKVGRFFHKPGRILQDRFFSDKLVLISSGFTFCSIDENILQEKYLRKEMYALQQGAEKAFDRNCLV